MTPEEIDNIIMQCPYFGGKNTIDRKIIDGELVHIGDCGLEFHYRKICPSALCACAKKMGFKEEEKMDDIHKTETMQHAPERESGKKTATLETEIKCDTTELQDAADLIEDVGARLESVVPNITIRGNENVYVTINNFNATAKEYYKE